ncbi:MAG TPA: DUF1294 domain-containing protein [Chloroflexi bacterium]|nr:DUF1294 domain-containing protein [Chloroflexota bacterium]
MQGTVVKFDDRKGFGFIQPDGQAEQIFVHVSAVSTAGRLTPGQRVTFEVTASPKGLRASNVVVAGALAKTAPMRSTTPISPYWFFGGLAVIDTAIVMMIGMFVFSLAWLWAYLIAINVTTLILYAYDKAVAGSGSMRVPERVLHVAELLGGTPAGFIGQRVLRHKSAKGSYQLNFWLIVVVQALIVIGLYWLGVM